MNIWSFRKFFIFRLVIFSLTISMALLPTIPTTSFAAKVQATPAEKTVDSSKAVTLHSDQKKKRVSEQTKKAESKKTDAEGMSTTTKIAIGAGAAVIIGAAVALGGGGGGGGSDSNSPDPTLPPTVDQLVGSWSASASSVEHLSYVGTYTLYPDGTHSYDLQMSEGYRKTGRGRWDINGYRLTLHNDTGTNYTGEFAAGNLVTIHLDTSVGWQNDLTKVL